MMLTNVATSSFAVTVTIETRNLVVVMCIYKYTTEMHQKQYLNGHCQSKSGDVRRIQKKSGEEFLLGGILECD